MKILLSVIAILGFPLAVVGIMAAFTHNIYYLFIGAVASLLVLLVISLIIFMIVTRSHHDWVNALIYFLKPSPKSTHIFLSREIIYEFNSRTSMKLTKKMKIQSSVNELRTIDDRYLWSKPGKCDLAIKEKQHKIVYEWNDLGWHYYSLLLASPLSKGDSTDITILMPNLLDPEMESSLFLSSNTVEKTRLLTLTVKVPRDLPIKRAEFCIFHGSICTSPKYKKELPIECDGTIVTKTIKFPRVGYKYLIRWEFDNP